MILLNPECVDLVTLRQLWLGAPCKLDGASLDRIRASAASVERIVAGGETVYGINTGFGLLANTRIPPERLAELQRNLILSHSCGLGDLLPRHVVRLMIQLKLLGLGRGYSGVRPLVIDALQALLDKDAMPLIPAQGSVGASGDLAPGDSIPVTVDFNRATVPPCGFSSQMNCPLPPLQNRLPFPVRAGEKVVRYADGFSL